MRARVSLVLPFALVLGLAPEASSRHFSFKSGSFGIPGRFELLTAPVGGRSQKRAARPRVSLAGGPIAAIDGGALVIDPDSGQLIRTDQRGTPLARIDIAPDAPQLAVDAASQLAYVVDRRNDRVDVVSLAGGRLRLLRAVATAAEPYGIALTPDGSRFLVSAVADRRLSAYSAKTGRELWRVAVGAEPRGVAISPDGAEVALGFLTTGAIARGRLRRDQPPALEQIPLHQVDARAGGARPAQPVIPGALHPDVAQSGNPNDRPGEGYARAAFAVSFIGNHIAVAAFQTSTPHQAEGSENTGGYGGGFTPPIAHQLAFVAGGDAGGQSRVATASLALHQPRAMAYDAERDRLYLVGYGSDALTAVGDASQVGVHLHYERALTEAGECGPIGAAVAGDGSVLIYCSLSRKVAVLSGEAQQSLRLAIGPELAPTRLSDDALAGRRIFRKGFDTRLSRDGAMACESCHPEARTDGLSWRIEGKVLQTPLLAGRVLGTHPFKWDGGDPTLAASLSSTVRRLGGTGLAPDDVKHLAAYLEALEPPRAPSLGNARSVARGAALFKSASVGCDSCHGGARLTDGRKHTLAHDMDATDTPSLVGVAGSAPYFHDGSAATLEALLTDRGTVHGMGGTRKLTDPQINDLVAYLTTL